MPQNAFLQILKSALNSNTSDITLNITKEEWMTVFRLAENHRLLPVMYDTIKAVYPFEETDLLPLKKRTKALVLEQILRSRAFLELYENLKKEGLSPIVVKGAVCRSLYPNGDNRYSTDEDLFVPEKDFNKHLDVFKKLSFFQKPQKSDDHQITLCNEIGLHIELHKALFPITSDYFKPWNTAFENSVSNPTQIQTDGTCIRTLCETDNLLYLTLHALKHFFHSGVGIRQICDIIMFVNKFGNRIDWNRFFEVCTKLKADKFALAVFAIGEKYLNFSRTAAMFPKEIDLSNTDELPLLEDILTGGIFGSSSMARQHSSGITYDAIQGKKDSLLNRIFPSAKKLNSKYSYAKKYPLFLPIAWVHRLINYKKEVSATPNNHPAAALQIGKRRLELLTYYGLISK